MTAVFLAGPMAWPPLLDIIAGAPVSAPEVSAATGVGLVAHPGKCFPVLHVDAAGSVDGVVLRAPEQALVERLTYFAAGLGCVPVECRVRTSGAGVAAMTFATTQVPHGFDHDWDHAGWAAKWGDLALSAAAEIMNHMGRFSESELPLRMPMILSRAASRQAAKPGVSADVRSATPADAVECRARHTRHAGFFLTEEYELRHPRFDGQPSPVVHREAFVATDAAIVLPYDPVRDRVLLVEQFRMGPYARGDNFPWMLEPVAGRVDAGEAPEQTAYRECREEAGLDLVRLEHIAGYYCTPGYSTEFFHCYLGICDLPNTRQGRGGLETEDEDIRTHVLSFDAAMTLCSTGEANNGPLVLSLIWLQRERERLRSSA